MLSQKVYSFTMFIKTHLGMIFFWNDAHLRDFGCVRTLSEICHEMFGIQFPTQFQDLLQLFSLLTKVLINSRYYSFVLSSVSSRTFVFLLPSSMFTTLVGENNLGKLKISECKHPTAWKLLLQKLCKYLLMSSRWLWPGSSVCLKSKAALFPMSLNICLCFYSGMDYWLLGTLIL